MSITDELREAKARILVAGARMERDTRRHTVDALRPFLRHGDDCGVMTCTCGLTAILTILEADPWSKAS